MDFLEIKAIRRFTLSKAEVLESLGGKTMLFDELRERYELKPVRANGKDTIYTVEAVERALRLAEADGGMVK
ncbi:MAG: hypothetical protein QM496_01810 [Verrucomicrobiota bacterium]